MIGRVCHGWTSRETTRESDATWVVFDNTARGEATGDALRLKEMLA